MNFIEELKWRNLFKDVVEENQLEERMKEPMTVYCGFDPTADSLHIGHLQQILLLKRWQQEGHHPIALVGGGTGMIGDPRPTTERQLQSLEQVQTNAKCIQKQIELVLETENNNNVTVVNNYEWLSKMTLLEFLRDYGKYFNINTMIAKDTIASRLDTGISFTEFTYTILQAIDWLMLFEKYNCEVQIGGSDQWGNLLSGVDLIRKVKAKSVFGVTSPLITKSDGSKFGKSEGKNVWLDSTKTDSYTFYQFWINVADDDVIDFTKRLSMKPVEEIMEIEKIHFEAPEKRYAQKELAKELTLLVFKSDGLESAMRISDALFNGDVLSLNANQLRQVFQDARSIVLSEDKNLIDTLVENQLIKSKREVRQLIQQGSLQLNGKVVTDFETMITKENAVENKISIIKKGKKSYYIIDHEAIG
ncbi:MAG: tyrosine--tRNA ligase [Erysipelothrix sp.]|nr:tyrosine--tRNA ligase [Erysipelothrix sp.]